MQTQAHIARTQRERIRATEALRDALRALLRAETRRDVMLACQLAVELSFGPDGLCDVLRLVEAYQADGEPMVDPRCYANAWSADDCAPEDITRGLSAKRGEGFSVEKATAMKEAEARALASLVYGHRWHAGAFPIFGES